MSIKVLVADDHEVVRHGLASLLSGSDIKIVAEAKDGKEAVQMARKHRPHVVLLDIRMPQADGLEALEQLRAELPEAKPPDALHDLPAMAPGALVSSRVHTCGQFMLAAANPSARSAVSGTAMSLPRT